MSFKYKFDCGSKTSFYVNRDNNVVDTYFNEIKLTSLHKKSTFFFFFCNSLAFAFKKSTLPLSSNFESSAQSATSTASTCFAPCLSKQSVKPPFEHPISAQFLPFTSSEKSSNAFSSLYAPCEA